MHNAPALIDIVRDLPPRCRTGGTVALMAAIIIGHRIAQTEARVPGTVSDALFAAGFTMEEVIEHCGEAIAIVTDPLIAGLLPQPRMPAPVALPIEHQVAS